MRTVIAAVVLVVLAGGAAIAALKKPARPRATVPRAKNGVLAPPGVRVRVQVLNGTTIHGLARRATMVLRDRGFDVVETGNAKGLGDSTLVLDLSGHPDWANRIAEVLGPARVQARADSSRYLDIAVILGTSWHPPAEPFYP